MQECADTRIAELAPRVVAAAAAQGFSIATAESCTGGLIAAALTDVPGSSEVFSGGVVSYTDAVKKGVLGVPSAVLDSVGAVSVETAEAMAKGARELIGTDFGVSTTGIAGPGGGTEETPVGTVCFAFARAGSCDVYRERFEGDRAAVRDRAVVFALELLLAELGA